MSSCRLLAIAPLCGLLLLPLAGHTQSSSDDATGPTIAVSISGLEDQQQLSQNVEAFLKILRLDGESAPSEGRVRFLHSQAEEQIRSALQPFGYYKPEIETELTLDNNQWQARYQIDPGPPVQIGELKVEISGDGRDDPQYQRVLDNLPLAEGDILVQPQYEDTKQAFQSIAAERGYFDARFTSNQIRIDIQAYDAAVDLTFDSGRRYRFGEVSFDQEILDNGFLDRFVDIEPGQPYTSDDLLKLQSDLIGSEYFSHVEVSAPAEAAEDYTIPVTVRLEPVKKHQYVFAIGYGTDTGARGKIRVENRRVNRRGHRYNAELQISQIKQSLTAEYLIPGSDPRTDSYTVRGGYIIEDSDVKKAETLKLGGTYQTQDGDWLKVYSLDFQREIFEVSGEETTTDLLIPGLSWTRVKADDRLDVRQGSRLNFQLRGAQEFLLSDITFVQASVSTKWIWPLGEKGRLLLRAEAGTTIFQDNNDFEKLPLTLRFYAGGDNSVRGYDLDSIGPRNDEDDVIGGKHLLVGSVEYDYEFRENWRLAAFIDAGDAFDDEAPEPKHGAGFGVRWQSPVGPIRVDLASGLDRPPGDTFRIHLSIGPDL